MVPWRRRLSRQRWMVWAVAAGSMWRRGAGFGLRAASPGRRRQRQGGLLGAAAPQVGKVGGSTTPTSGFHTRNKHPGRYDFARLAEAYPALTELLYENPLTRQPTLDWSRRESVMAINAAILRADYGVRGLEECVPEGYLVPPIPSRVDYVHIVGDLLTARGRAEPPRSAAVVGVDVGTGASAIYAMLGRAEYGWAFVASDVDPVALAGARKVVSLNDAHGDVRVVDATPSDPPWTIFTAEVRAAAAGAAFTMSNPPFHESAAQAARLNLRKRKGLLANKLKRYPEKHGAGFPPDALNYGGQAHELWCEGGELKFVGDMIYESSLWHHQALDDNDDADCPVWFTSLVSKGSRVPDLEHQARDQGATEVRVREFKTTQKISRILAWSFHRTADRNDRLDALYTEHLPTRQRRGAEDEPHVAEQEPNPPRQGPLKN